MSNYYKENQTHTTFFDSGAVVFILRVAALIKNIHFTQEFYKYTSMCFLKLYIPDLVLFSYVYINIKIDVIYCESGPSKTVDNLKTEE